jgi:hypothetical protein
MIAFPGKPKVRWRAVISIIYEYGNSDKIGRVRAVISVIVLTKNRTDCHLLTTDFYLRSDKDSAVG